MNLTRTKYQTMQIPFALLFLACLPSSTAVGGGVFLDDDVGVRGASISSRAGGLLKGSSSGAKAKKGGGGGSKGCNTLKLTFQQGAPVTEIVPNYLYGIVRDVFLLGSTKPVGRYQVTLQYVSEFTDEGYGTGLIIFNDNENELVFQGSLVTPAAITGGLGKYVCSGGYVTGTTGPNPNTTRYIDVVTCGKC